MSGHWSDIGEAALELGISTEAVRKRIQRGKLRAERHQDKLQVWLDDVRTESVLHAQGEVMLVEELRDRVRFLEGQLEQANDRDRENRRIIAALTQRIPELEAPQEPPGGPQSAGEGAGRPEPRSSTGGAQEGAEPRSWWRRVFGGG